MGNSVRGRYMEATDIALEIRKIKGDKGRLKDGDHEDSGESEKLRTDINTVQIAAGEGEERPERDHEILESRRN
jgi:hypothetical protein